MLRWILRRLPIRWLETLDEVCEEEVERFYKLQRDRAFKGLRPFVPIAYTEADIATLERLKAEPIEDDDCVFNDPIAESAVRDPTLPLPGTLGWGDEIPTIPPPPPQSDNVDHLFRQREEEEANQKLCHCGCRYTAVVCPNCLKDTVKEAERLERPVKKCPECGQEMSITDDDGRSSPTWLCWDCGEVK